jgi:hypothetical protein
METIMDDHDQTPNATHAAKARRTRRKTQAEPARTSAVGNADTAAPEGDAKQEWTSKLPEPFGRHGIDLGDGRRLKLLRSNRWQQSQIVFAASENEDPKPDAKYTRWLRDHGWQWRGQDKAWTKQFAKNTDQERYARSNSDLAAQIEFIELANLIRQDKGLTPVALLDEPERGVGT